MTTCTLFKASGYIFDFKSADLYPITGTYQSVLCSYIFLSTCSSVITRMLHSAKCALKCSKCKFFLTYIKHHHDHHDHLAIENISKNHTYFSVKNTLRLCSDSTILRFHYVYSVVYCDKLSQSQENCR